MPRLPDIRIESWLEDQQKRFSEATAGLWDATEFELGARQQEAMIPPDYDAVGGMDQWEQAEQDLLEKTYRAQQQADEERQRQEVEAQAEQYRQQQQQAEAQAALAQQAEQTQQQQQESSMMDMIRSLGIPTPSDAFESFKAPGDPTSSSGIFDVGAPPQSDMDAFNQFAGGMQTDAFGAPTPDPLANQPPQPDHTSSSGLLDQIGSAVQSGISAVGSAFGPSLQSQVEREDRTPEQESLRQMDEMYGGLGSGPRRLVEDYGVGALERSTAEQGEIRREAEAFDAEQGITPRSFRQQTMEPISPEYRAANPERATKFDEAQSEWQNLAMGASGGLGAGRGGVADDAVQAIKTLIKHGVGDDVVLAMERSLADKSDLALSAVQKLTRGIPEATPPWLPDEADRAEVARQDAEIAGRPAHAGYLAEDVADAERATSGTPSDVGPTGFRTAKGSTYEILPDGTTARNKAERSDVGHEGDFGPKEPSAATYYLDSEVAPALGFPQGRSRLIDHGDGTLSVATQNANGRWGIAPSQRNIPYSRTPTVGSTPLEAWKPDTVQGLPAYGQVHFGNQITEVFDAAPRPFEVGPSPTRAPGGSTPYDQGPEVSSQGMLPGMENVAENPLRPPGTEAQREFRTRAEPIFAEMRPLTRSERVAAAAEKLDKTPEQVEAAIQRNLKIDPRAEGVEQEAMNMRTNDLFDQWDNARQEWLKAKQELDDADLLSTGGSVPDGVKETANDAMYWAQEIERIEHEMFPALKGSRLAAQASSKRLNAQRGSWLSAAQQAEAGRLDSLAEQAGKTAKTAQKVAREGKVDKAAEKDLRDLGTMLGSEKNRRALTGGSKTAKEIEDYSGTPLFEPGEKAPRTAKEAADELKQEQRRVAGISAREKSKEKRAEIQVLAQEARTWAHRMRSFPKLADQMRPNFEDALLKLDEHSQSGNKVADDIRQRLSVNLDEQGYTRAFEDARKATESISDARIRAVQQQIKDVLDNPHAPDRHLRVAELYQDLSEINAKGMEMASKLRRQTHLAGIQKSGLFADDANTEYIAQIMRQLDPNKPSTFRPIMEAMNKPGLWDMMREISFINMLSQPVTHLTNISSTLANAGLYGLIQSPTEHLFSGGKMSGSGSFWSGFAGSTKEGAKLFAQTMSSGINPRRLEAVAGAGEYRHIGNEALPVYLEKMFGAGGRKYGEAMHMISTRPLEAADAMIGHMAYEGAVFQGARRKADQMIRTQDSRLAGMDLSNMDPTLSQAQKVQDYIQKNIWDFPEIIKEAGNLQDYLLFRSRGQGPLEKRLRMLVGIKEDKEASPAIRALADFVLPFWNVPYNFTKQGLGNVVGAPVGLAKAGVGLAKGDAEMVGKGMGQAAKGAALMGAAASFALSDNLTGAGPEDEGDRRAWLDTHRPNSFRLPGTKGWVSYEGTPWAIPFAVMAGVKEALEFGKVDPQNPDWANALQYGIGIAKGASRGALSQSFLDAAIKNAGVFMGADLSPQGGASLVSGTTSRYTPSPIPTGMLNFLSQMGETVERDAGRARDMKDIPEVAENQLRARIPGLRQELPAQTGAFGQTVEARRPNLYAAVPRSLLPERAPGGDDPIAKQLERGSVGITQAPKELAVSKGSVPLTIQEQARFQKVYGEFYRQALEHHGAGTKTLTDNALIGMRDWARKQAAQDFFRSLPRDEYTRRWKNTPPVEVAP